MNQIREQFGVIMLVCVLIILLTYSWFFRADHDTIVSTNQWISGVIGGILTLVTGKVAQAVQTSRISGSTVTQVVESDSKAADSK